MSSLILFKPGEYRPEDMFNRGGSYIQWEGEGPGFAYMEWEGTNNKCSYNYALKEMLRMHGCLNLDLNFKLLPFCYIPC